MARGAAGEEAAFRTLVERWERPVFAFLVRMLGSPEEAQDLGQETFLRVCQQAGRYRPEDRFQSWLFRIAGNLARSRLRRRRILEWVPFDPGLHDRETRTVGPERQVEQSEARLEVQRALDQLPVRQREAIVLRHYQEMSHAEIGEAMGVSVSAVESLIHRALEGLRKQMGMKREGLS